MYEITQSCMMTEELDFIRKHRSKGALLDANLLLVYLVGKINIHRLETFHHTKQYVSFFPLLRSLVEMFPKIYTTPNVLTEVSNLGHDLGEGFYHLLKQVVPHFDEKYCVSGEAVSHPNFNTIGLTDAAL